MKKTQIGKYVQVGYIPGDLALTDRIDRLLKKAGILADIGGSKGYGITVKRNDRDRAIKVLKQHSLKEDLRISFVD